MTESTEPTSGEFIAISGAAVQLADEVTDLHRRLRQASTDPVRRVGYRLDDIAGELRRISDGLCANARELRRAQDVLADPSLCHVQWGVCPEHGNTLTSTGGISVCRIDSRSWGHDRAGSLCGEPVTDVITDPAGGTNVMCHGHAIAVPHTAGWSSRPTPADPDELAHDHRG